MKKYIIVDSYTHEIVKDFDTLEQAKSFKVDYVDLEEDAKDYHIAEILYNGAAPKQAIEWKKVK